MRKRLPWTAGVLLLAASASGQGLWAGTQEIMFGGAFHSDSAEGPLWRIDAAYGFFPWDYLQVLLRGGMEGNDLRSGRRLGLAAEKSVDLGRQIVPFYGLGFSLLEAELQWTDREGARVKRNTTALGLDLSLGMKFFLSENVALSAALVGELASKKVFPAPIDSHRHRGRIDAGIRFFF